MSLGIDEGGTFTDFAFISPSSSEIKISKVSSGERNAFGVFLRGLDQMGVALEEVERITYGTTTATNAVLERGGPQIGLLCTRGFPDILDHQRWHQRVLYDLHQERPVPLVRRGYRCEVTERTSGQGEVLVEPDREEIERAIEFLQSEGIESLAVAFLNSYANGSNERCAADYMRERGVRFISLSSEIAPILSEWERTSTAVLNAYTQPILEAHLGSMRDELDRCAPRVRLNVMQSNGGSISSEQAIRQSVRTMLSGPAGGVSGAKVIANAAGFKNVITVDMGGTSCDVSVIIDGKEEVTKEAQISYNLPVRIPMLLIHTIGAGGGSIATVDRGGALKVGPESAGAVPGPACYGRGGTQATVTDAHLLLNHLPPYGLLGGRMPLDRSLSESAVGVLANRLSLSTARTAAGILHIANNLMVEAIRLMTVNRGLDPRDFCLLAFGGMSPMHACDLAAELGIETVLIPRLPGVLSALGLAIADLKTEILQSINKPISRLSVEYFRSIFQDLESQCSQRLAGQGISPRSQEFIWSADVRYPSQTFDISVPIYASDMTDGFSALTDRFHALHDTLYAYSIRSQAPFVVNAQVTGVARLSEYSLPTLHEAAAETQVRARRPTILGQSESADDTAVYRRADLLAGSRIDGPALVEQEDTTVMILPTWQGKVDAFGNLVLRRR